LCAACLRAHAHTQQDVNEGDKEARRPLHYAAGFNHLGIAQLLLAEGAQLEVADSKGNTPLHYAAGYGRAKLVGVARACCSGWPC
jgi:ankyrin repeat protein